MSYYRILGFQKEPFSTSPDPSLFYLSKEHQAALYRLRISLKLRRGLSLILGDVGTGKTTLSRRFVQLVRDEPKINVHLILNPLFSDENDFLRELCVRFGVPLPPEGAKTTAYYNEIEGYLFRKGVNEGQTIVLILDEAQKLNPDCLEALRGLLNYETNDYKILQVILFAQLEIVPRLSKMKNFWDRVSLKHLLRPLEFEEMKEMIAFRIAKVGYESPVSLFSEEALEVIFRATSGFPRQVTQLCHDCLEYLVMFNKPFVDRNLVEHLVTRDSHFFVKEAMSVASAHGRETQSERFDARRAAV